MRSSSKSSAGKALSAVRLTRKGAPLRGADLLAAAPLLFLAIYLVATTSADQRTIALALEVAICVAAALSTRWLLAGSISTGVLLTILAFLTHGETRLGAFACLGPIILAGASGRWALTTGLTVWYLSALAILESPNAEPHNLVSAAWTWSLVLCIGLLLAAGLDRIRRQRLESEQRRTEELLEQRRVIARELHDTISHNATLALLRATAAREHLDDQDLIAADLDYLTDSCRQMTVDLRTLLSAIRGPVDIPLADAPKVNPRTALAHARSTLERAGFQPSILLDGELDDLAPETAEALVRTVTEASANIVRHGARHQPCSLLVERSDECVEFVATNTIGEREFVHGNGYGLLGLGERIRSLGGELNVSSTPPNWVLHARIPLHQIAEAVQP